MAPQKRPAGAMKKEAKRPRTVEDPTAAHIKAVADAVREAEGFPATLIELLCGSLQNSLALVKEERHQYQVQIVDMIDSVLQQSAEGLEAKVQAAAAVVGEADKEKSSRESAAQAAVEHLKAQTEALAAAKVTVSEATEAAKLAKKALDDAKAEQKATDDEAQDAVGKKQSLEDALNKFVVPMKAGAFEGKLDKGLKEFSQLMKPFRFDTTMMISLSSALARAPAARGSFDNVVIDQVEAEIGNKLAALTATIEQAGPAQAEHAQKVEAATAASASAADAEAAAKESLAKAKNGLKEAEDAKKSSATAVKDFASDMHAATQKLEALQSNQQLLRDGALKAFAFLSQRSSVVEAAVEEPAVAAEALIPELFQAAAAEEPVAMEAVSTEA